MDLPLVLFRYPIAILNLLFVDWSDLGSQHNRSPYGGPLFPLVFIAAPLLPVVIFFLPKLLASSQKRQPEKAAYKFILLFLGVGWIMYLASYWSAGSSPSDFVYIAPPYFK